MSRSGPVYETSPEYVPDWRDQAECLKHDPNDWFPIGETGSALIQIEAAKAICAICPVRAECLAWSLEKREPAPTVRTAPEVAALVRADLEEAKAGLGSVDMASADWYRFSGAVGALSKLAKQIEGVL